MIKSTDIKPIPKYIINKIKKLDEHHQGYDCNGTTYYSYLTKIKNDLALITVGCKTKNHQWFCKQVAVHYAHSDKCFVRDIEYGLFGFVIGWSSHGMESNNKAYDDGKWYEANDKYYKIHCPVINKKYALTFQEYKYSVADKYKYNDFMNYLRIYEEYPQAEYLMKLGLPQFATNKTILKLVGKDKQFRKWIIKNKEILQNKYGQEIYLTSQIIIDAYKKDISINDSHKLVKQIKKVLESYQYRNTVNQFIHKKDIEKLIKYFEKQNTGIEPYEDYLKACIKLNLDMNDEKTLFPKDFHRMHDLRIDEYDKVKIKEDEKARKELYNNFKKIAEKYSVLERLLLKDDYICIIAKSPAELINEGKVLHHCVGRMNYDQKFAREESLIFFIRNRLAPNTPYVTLEYSLNNHKILQCYAEHNKKPDADVLEFVNKKWLPYANRKIKNLVA